MKLTPAIILFYAVSGLIVMGLFYKRSRQKIFSFLVSTLVILVASEYYEIPIFIAGLIGVAYWFPYPSLPFFLHHVNTIVLFIWLLVFTRPKMSFDFFAILGLGIIFNIFLLLPGSPVLFLYIARIIGIMCICGVIYLESTVLRS